MSAAYAPEYAPVPLEHQPFGLPPGSIRGFLSVLICSFFWIVLLLPVAQVAKIPLAHFFLLTLVFLAFASHSHRPDTGIHILPWLMRVLFVGGSVAVIGYMGYKDLDLVKYRLTPRVEEVVQWPGLLLTLSAGFAFGLFLRYVLGARSHSFQTLRAWIGVLAMLCLVAETLIQFVILPNMSEPPDVNKLRFWEATNVALVAAYFGSRA